MATAARAKVEGGTPGERIDSICRLADDHPLGAAGAIAKAAEGDPDAGVRRAALQALGRMGEGGHRGVAEAATRDASPAVRGGAAQCLGCIGDAAAADRLGEMAQADPAREVRLDALEGLYQAKHPRAVVQLVRIMEANDDPDVQVRALKTITKRLGFGMHTHPAPQDKPGWAKLVANIRKLPGVRKALEAAGDK
jgi:hypothetical protein